MSNSMMISHTHISPNKSVMTNKVNKCISIHCMAGNLSIESCGNLFAKTSTQASSNYGIGSDGRIALYVEEKDRSWCTSSAKVDGSGISIEVANDGGAPDWHVSDKALDSLIKLCTDICQRNEFRLNYTGDKSGNLQAHRWWKNKACPGNYLMGLFPYIAAQVNANLDGGVSVIQSQTANAVVETPTESVSTNRDTYIIRAKIDNLRYRESPNGRVLGYLPKNIPFTIVETVEGWGKLKSGAGWVYVANSEYVSRDGVGATSSNDSYYPKYNGDSASLTNALQSLKIDSSKSSRTKIAHANGISDYSFTAEQNTMLLNLLKQGKLKKS